MNIKDKIRCHLLNDSHGVSRCIKANYYKMGERNFIFTKADGFSATCVMIEYE